MPVALKGSTSGDITLTAPAVAGTTTITLPATTGNAVVDVATQTLTNKTLTSPVINTPTMGGSVITSGTAQSSASGTSIDFTGIPSWVKRITVMFIGVSTTSGTGPSVQLGTSGGVEATGYISGCIDTQSGGTSAVTSSTTGFDITSGSTSALLYGPMIISSFGSNIWVATANVFRSDSTAFRSQAGSKTLSGTLDRIRITGPGFDAGTINILYE